MIHAAESALIFIPLGDLPGGATQSSAHAISADGSTVVGSGSSGLGFEAFIWTKESGMTGLGYLTGGTSSNASGVSGNGTFIAGSSRTSASPSENTATRWESSGGILNLGGGNQTFARDLSDDGTVVVGFGNGSFRWSSTSGMAFIGPSSTKAWAVSGNGLTVVGDGLLGAGSEAYLWTEQGGLVGLGDLPGGTFWSAAYGVSTNGATIVGESESAFGNEAFIWTASAGMVGLGDLAGGAFSSEAHDISGDGSVVVGNGTTANGTEAFIWDSVNGMRTIREALGDNGSLMDGWTNTVAFGIADDGRSVVGYGTNPNGIQEAWYAVIPEPSIAAMILLSGFGFLLRKR